MAKTREERLERLFEVATSLPAGRRDAFLDTVRREEPELAAELSALLRHSGEAPGIVDDALDRALAEHAAALLDTPAVNAARDPLIGRRISRYEILDYLAGGGMGEVYRARDVTLDRVVALKFLPLHLNADRAARDRLIAEARAASALDHPNICTVHEIGETDATVGGRLFIAMAYCGDETVRDRLASGPLPIAQALAIAQQTADALAAAADAGIVHRDLKPANLVITERGQVKVVDFGVARLVGADVTRPGITVGTIAYMSPEQTRGGTVDARTDIWSLGVVLFEVLTGTRPFPAEDGAALLHSIRHDRPPSLRQLRPDAPPALEPLLERCLHQDPGQRPLAGVLRDELRRIETEVVIRAARVGDFAHPTRPVHRTRVALAFVALALLLLAARGIWRSGSEDELAYDADAVAILPFLPLAADSPLERLGRELARTAVAVLAGIEDVRLVEPRQRAWPTALSAERALELGRAAGAGRVLIGTLSRSGAGVRLDARLEGGGHPEAVEVDGAAGAALADSVALALVRALWRSRPLPSPTHGAVQTRSIAALRDFLEGERLLARGDMPRAVEAFERAFASDTTLWFAYWRSLYPRQWYPAGRPDTARNRQLIERRHTFPPQDRLLVEAWMTDRLSDRLRLLREATDRFDGYWPAWYAYAVELVTRAPYLGTTLDDARDALERTLALNPDFATAWDRLGWVITAQRDTAAIPRALAGFNRTMAGVEFRSVMRRHAALLTGLMRTGVPAADSLERVVDSLLSESEPVVVSFAVAALTKGLPRLQLGLNDALLAREPAARVTAALWTGNALAWVARGAWDSALVAVDRAAVASPDARAALDRYGLAVTGGVLGLSPADQAARRRPEAPGSLGWTDAEHADLVWLDGILAYAGGDAQGVARARAALEASSVAHAATLRGSLAAFALDAAGQRARAAQELARVEWESADRAAAARLAALHPFLVPVNRLSAARWLRENGAAGEAARLLTWSDAIGTAWPTALNATFGGIALIDRAELAEAAGQPERASVFYARFLERHDLADASYAPLIERARAGLERTRRGR